MADLSDEQLTAIYKKANGEATGKSRPITTASIFRAMRAVADQVRREERERIAAHFDAMPGREMFGGTIADEIRDMQPHEQTTEEWVESNVSGNQQLVQAMKNIAAHCEENQDGREGI